MNKRFKGLQRGICRDRFSVQALQLAEEYAPITVALLQHMSLHFQINGKNIHNILSLFP